MRRYLLVFACPVLLVVAAATLLSIFFGPVKGDLVRIGRWAERDFGGQVAQPVFAIKGNGKEVVDPDILVLGDSFSSGSQWQSGNLWQSVISTRLNQKTLSFHYEQVGCLNNWLQFALDNLSAKTVIVEIVERNFIGNFREPKPCQKMQPQPFEVAVATTSVSARWPLVVNLEYAFTTAKNTVKMIFNVNAPVRGRKVVNAPIKTACANFSNRRADRILYLKADEAKLDWTQEDVRSAVAGVLEVQALFQTSGKKFIFVVVPDKSTVYQHCLLGGDFETATLSNVTDSLIAAGVNTPNLLRSFREKAGNFVDLYKPDDTHLSDSGFVFLGDEIERFMAENSGVQAGQQVLP